jgi:hypothetical protein
MNIIKLLSWISDAETLAVRTRIGVIREVDSGMSDIFGGCCNSRHRNIRCSQDWCNEGGLFWNERYLRYKDVAVSDAETLAVRTKISVIKEVDSGMSDIFGTRMLHLSNDSKLGKEIRTHTGEIY